MVIYSRAADDADNNLEFKLRRSIDLIEREKAMAKKNGKKKGERATVSRERRLALALRAVLDAISPLPIDDIERRSEVDTAVEIAANTLNDFGYKNLISIPKRLKELNEQLAKAVEAGDGKEISRLGLEIERAKQGKEPVAEKAAAAEA